MTRQVAGVILAGGKSRRFGTPKEAIQIGGETLLERTHRVLREALGADPVVVREDLRPGFGPLGGIETALSATDSQELLVVACDMPGLSPELLVLLADFDGSPDLVVPRQGGRLHPLCARWHRRMLAPIRDALDADRRAVTGVLRGRDVQIVEEAALEAAGIDPRRGLWNVNRPQDLDRPA